MFFSLFFVFCCTCDVNLGFTSNGFVMEIKVNIQSEHKVPDIRKKSVDLRSSKPSEREEKER